MSHSTITPYSTRYQHTSSKRFEQQHNMPLPPVLGGGTGVSDNRPQLEHR